MTELEPADSDFAGTWGVAQRHQQAHPEAWTPELVAETASWTAVAKAIELDQQDAVVLLKGEARNGRTSFVDRCAAEPELRRQLEHLCERELHGLLIAWLLEGMKERLTSHAVPHFWEHYHELAGRRMSPGIALQRHSLASACTAVARLHTYMSGQLRLVRLLDLKGWREGSKPPTPASAAGSSRPMSSCDSGSPSPMAAEDAVPDEAAEPTESRAADELLAQLQALLLILAPDVQALHGWMALCWERAFLDTTREERSAAWAWQEGDGEEEEEVEEEEAEGMQVDGDGDSGAPPPPGPALRQQVREFCTQLAQLRWLPLVEPSLSATLHAQLRAALTTRCADRFEARQLSRLLGWLKSVVMPWLRLVLQPEDAADAADAAALQQWHARLRFVTMQSLASLRISELFGIIKEWPDSTAAVDDLEECLRHTREHSRLVSSLRSQIAQRLLKPGVDTSKIIAVYIDTIRALRHLDPTGVLLEAVSEPMRAYLKGRADTVRQIVTLLTDPESSELLEAAGGDGEADFLQDDIGADDDALDLDEIRGDEKAMMQWQPDPINSDPSRSSYSRRSSDVLACLVNIYGSKALFVNEFRAMLADKLLSAPHHAGAEGAGFDTERDTKHLELLKRRFGESALNHCEVRRQTHRRRVMCSPTHPNPNPPPHTLTLTLSPLAHSSASL